MSAESVSELPIHYGEVQKDGTRIERPSEERSRGRPFHDEPSSQVRRPSQSAMLNRPSLGLPEQDFQPRGSKDETRTNRGDSHGRPNHQQLGGSLDVGKPSFGRNDHRRGIRQRRRYDDSDRYSDYDDEYDEPYRPRRIQNRAYFPGDEYGPRRRPSRASRYGTTYSQDPRRRSLEDYDEEPYTPRRHHSQKKPLAYQSPFIEHEGEDYEEEEVIYPRDRSPGNNKPLRFKDLTRAEKKEIMRLPWTQWMDSNFKNREGSEICTILSYSR